jgi:hypothetical protein
MKRYILLTALLLILLSLSGKTTVTRIDETSYLVSWENPGWKLASQLDFTFLVSDLGMSATPGAPQLPFDECKIAVPEGGSISLNLTAQSGQEIVLEKRLLPVPRIFRNSETDTYEYTVDEQLYASAVNEPFTILPLQRFRSLTFVPIRINPFLYDGKSQLKAYDRIEFTVTISGNVNLRSNLPLDDLTSLVAEQTINPTQAVRWQSMQRAPVNYADFSLSDHWVKVETDKDGMFRITPSQLSMLPVADIDPKTFRLFTTGGETLPYNVSYAGPVFREVPIYVKGESDGTFNSTDYILFYGRDREGLEMNQTIGPNQNYNPYSGRGCYWLTFGGGFSGTPLRITLAAEPTTPDTTVTFSPETVRMESETFQRIPTGFEWFTGKFFGSTSSEYLYDINLEDIDNTQPQTLSLLLKQEFLSNGSSNVHRVRLKVNGNQLLNSQNTVQEWSWIGLSPIIITHTGNYFTSGNNTLGINVLRTATDNLFFDYYQVAYQKKLIKRNKQFTVNVPNALANLNIRYSFTGSSTDLHIFRTAVTGSLYEVAELPFNAVSGGFDFTHFANPAYRYLVTQESDYYAPTSVTAIDPVDLTVAAESYDNIIITPSDFLQSAQSLAAFYRQQFNTHSKVVLLQDIFNQFNAGMPDPVAVRLFLRHAAQNYPAPHISSVTLLGSGTNDWRNYSGISATKNKMIVFQRDSSTTDDYFGFLTTDQYPELAIGRYPVRTQNELDNMLDNLDRYVTEPTPGIWRNNLLFLADDEFNGPTVGEFSHSQQLQETSDYINKSILIDKIFAIDYEVDEFQNKPAARDDMVKGINDGKLVWYYIGHGSFDTLGAEDYFKGSLDMGRFDNPGKLPLFVAASCDVAQFDSFSFDCLAEKVVLLDNKACIASIAATRECNGPSNVALLKQYYRYSLNLRNRIGYSLVSAKVVYTEYNSNDEKYIILGDPLLLIAGPQRDSTLTVVLAENDNVLNSREQVTLNGQFPQPGLNAAASVLVFDSEVIKTMPQGSTYTFRGRKLFDGNATVAASQYSSSFIVPDDVTNGNRGLILSYLWDASTQKDYVNYYAPVTYSDQAVAADNPDAPQIQLYLDDTDFVSGDVVGTSPLLIARISDSNGINLTDSPGHSLLLILDQKASTTNVTSYFSYDADSFTTGTLNYQLASLSEGSHTLQLIAFDNFNRPSVASTDFMVRKSKTFTVEDFLPYPNPMSKDGWFTFRLSDAADVTIGIYTIRGRKIKTIKTTASKGYNQIPWDGRDEDGDRLGNNTYFIKITAKALSGSAKAEKTEKLIIYN